MDAVVGHKPATCPPVVIESGSSSFSCDLGPTVSNPTTMSSSSMVNTIDNNDNDVEEENSVGGSEITGHSSREREELSSSWSETPELQVRK